MKKISLFIIIVLTFLIGINNTYAASGSITVKTNNKIVIVGNTVNVTVTVSSNSLGAWQYCMSYDSSVLKLISSDADANTCVKTGYVTNKSQKSATNTFTFKALKSGSTNVSVKSYAIYDYTTEEQMSTSISGVKLTTMTQKELEATYSTNANLKSLSVNNYELIPKFNKNTLEYSLEVPNDVTSVTINGAKEDATAEVSGFGTKSLSEGDNIFEILVTAQKGNTKTYTVKITRKELDPIKVTVNGENYYIVRKSDSLPEYRTFTQVTINYKEDEIPALKSEITDYTIVGLKDEEAKIHMFIYKDDVFTRYVEVRSNDYTIFPQSLPENEMFKNYKKESITFNGLITDAYLLSEHSNQAIIYGQNIETGETKYYLYDKTNNVLIEYDNEIQEYFNEKLQNMKYVLMGFIGLSIILLFIIIVRRPKKKIIYKDSFAVKDNNKKEEKNNKKNKGKEEVNKDKVVEVEEIKLPEAKKEVINDENKLLEEKYKSMNLVTDNANLSKKEIKKIEKKLHKEEKARLKEF